MPWCEDCSKFWTPTSLNRDGTCPTCGRRISEPVRTPWHFKLMLVALVIYLAYRAAQGIAWLAHHL